MVRRKPPPDIVMKTTNIPIVPVRTPVNSNGGGLCIGVLNDVRPVWVDQGDDEFECLTVEIWADDFPLRVTAHGPQIAGRMDRKV